MKRYGIVGGGIAGVHCVEGIRSRDPEGAITLLTTESHANYGRPLISYYLEGKTDLAHMHYRGADFFARNAVELRLETTVSALDPEALAVYTDAGECLYFNEICLCQGSAPFVPKMEGLETVPQRFTFTTLSDALALEACVSEKTRVFILGAGFIGLKCAEGLRDRVERVMVADLAPHAMSANLDADGGAFLDRHLTKNGLELYLGDTVRCFEGQTAILQSGRQLSFDILVLAIGVRPQVALAQSAGLQIDRGILVDTHMKTSAPHVYAAGDCVALMDISSGERGVLAVLPNAAMEGRCAGVNMAGGDAEFSKGIRMNSIGFFGLHIMSAGTYTEPVYVHEDENGIKKLFARHWVLTGFMLLGDVHRAGVYTSLIRERTPLDTLDFEALCRDPSLLPFGRDYRRAKLGGAVA